MRGVQGRGSKAKIIEGVFPKRVYFRAKGPKKNSLFCLEKVYCINNCCQFLGKKTLGPKAQNFFHLQPDINLLHKKLSKRQNFLRGLRRIHGCGSKKGMYVMRCMGYTLVYRCSSKQTRPLRRGGYLRFNEGGNPRTPLCPPINRICNIVLFFFGQLKWKYIVWT